MSNEKPKPDNGIVSSPTQQNPEEVKKYWTKERMADANPLPLPTVPPEKKP